ncbi:MAG: GNAT family N-acetyltransferase [Oscillospiraceae bacterium]|nr:GNAT family N-acetyltransferase [Oscillospiraceae bacterium]
MVISPAPEMLDALKNIWMIGFQDDQPSTDFVFENLLSPAQMLVKTDEQGEPAAILSIKKLAFTSGELTFAGGYIFGIATLPAHRGKGYASALVQAADDLLRKEGAALACLLPANAGLFDFYAARGYSTRFDCGQLDVTRDQIPAGRKGGVLSVTALEDLAGERAQAFASSSLFGMWDIGYLRYTGRECHFYGGEVLRFSSGGKRGYLVCYRRNPGTILVKEAVLGGIEIDDALAALHARYGAELYQIRFPAELCLPDKWPVRNLPFGMVKWYDETLPEKLTGGPPWFAFGLDD